MRTVSHNRDFSAFRELEVVLFISGALKMQDRKMQDLKMQDQIAGDENAGPENVGPQKQDRKMEDKLTKAIT